MSLNVLLQLVQHRDGEVQNMLPQNMLLWDIDEFELKTLEKQQIQKGLSQLPLSS